MKNHLFNMLFLYFLSASASYAQNPEALIDSIITHNIFESERIGGAGEMSVQYTHFKELTEMLSKQEIQALTSHKNGVLRMYAITYLIEDAGADPIPFFLKELERNELIETFEGCLMDYEYIYQTLFILATNTEGSRRLGKFVKWTA